jgi:hypothetical protein
MDDERDTREGSEFRRWRQDREIELHDLASEAVPEVAPTVQPCRVPPPLTTPAKPGNYFAAAARKAGCEDEYDNAMEARYGKGW